MRILPRSSAFNERDPTRSSEEASGSYEENVAHGAATPFMTATSMRRDREERVSVT